MAAQDINEYALDNGRLRFGTGSEDSLTPHGTLKQPWYRSNDGNWYKLTFSSRALEVAVGVGTGGGNWTGSSVVMNPTLTSTTRDNTGFAATTSPAAGVAAGHGIITTSGTATINGVPIVLGNRFELGAESRFAAITTTVTNPGATEITNVQLWVGTGDDYVGNDDRPTKVRGTSSTERSQRSRASSSLPPRCRSPLEQKGCSSTRPPPGRTPRSPRAVSSSTRTT